MTYLLDGNVLVALVVEDHVHHAAARDWFSNDVRFATCPVTQGTLLRLLVRNGMTAVDAVAVLTDVIANARHEFWPDDIGYDKVRMAKVVGHRQITDAYLAQVARERSARLVTLDRGLAATHDDVVELIAA
jgi:toxin-antitoxin system PIN domain toxin